MSRVYVIEGDASLREILVQSLQQTLAVEAVGFGLVEEALQAWPNSPPDMVLSELALPGLSGVDLAQELEACGWLGPLVFFSEQLEAFGPSLPQRPHLAVLAKPFDLGALLEYVHSELSQFLAAEEPSPQAPFGLFDYVQLSCVGGHTVEINLFDMTRDDELVGRVIVLGGELWSAQDGQGIGSDAFLRLACFPNLRVTCNALLQTSIPRNIPCAWDALLLRAATLRDDVQQQVAAHEQQGFPAASGPLERPGVGSSGFENPEAQDHSAQGGYPAVVDPAYMAQRAVAPAHEPTLNDMVIAANAAEDAGSTNDALGILEQAMVRFPGHPEILLAVLRLRKSTGR